MLKNYIPQKTITLENNFKQLKKSSRVYKLLMYNIALKQSKKYNTADMVQTYDNLSLYELQKIKCENNRRFKKLSSIDIDNRLVKILNNHILSN